MTALWNWRPIAADLRLGGYAICPVCEGGGGWNKLRDMRISCNYCRGGGLVTAGDAEGLAGYGVRLRELNDGEVPF
ncbi:hypothetical protein KHP62_07055 [Rhodobacteraceae bacterium NNCM2]|nr:hypothetical protein [Coraliihabitans acroporae]